MPGCKALQNPSPALSSFASGSRCGLLLRDGQITRPFTLSILFPGFTLTIRGDLAGFIMRPLLWRSPTGLSMGSPRLSWDRFADGVSTLLATVSEPSFYVVTAAASVADIIPRSIR